MPAGPPGLPSISTEIFVTECLCPHATNEGCSTTAQRFQRPHVALLKDAAPPDDDKGKGSFPEPRRRQEDSEEPGNDSKRRLLRATRMENWSTRSTQSHAEPTDYSEMK